MKRHAALAAALAMLALIAAPVVADVDLNGTKREVSGEALEGDTLKLKVVYDGVVYALACKITGDAIDGTWEGGGNSGTLTAKRRP